MNQGAGNIGGTFRRARGWIGTRPAMKWSLICVALLGMATTLFYIWLTFHFFIGDDLIIDLGANQTSFRISNIEQAPVQVALKTDAQLFCTTICNLTLLNVSTQQTGYSRQFTMGSGDQVTQAFNLSPGHVGEGQSIYSVTASCRNVRSLLCPTLAPERRKTVLIIVNYGLSTDEVRAKPVIRQQLEAMLATLRQADLLLQEASFIVARNPRLQASPLLANTTAAQDAFYRQKLFLENAQGLWRQESYVVLYNLMQGSEVTPESVNKTRTDAAGIKQALLSLAQLHNMVRDSLDATRNELNATIAAHELPPAELVDPLINRTNLLVAAYDDGSGYATMQESISSLASAVRRLNTTLALRESNATSAGDALIAAQAAELCDRNITCGNVSATSTGSICRELSFMAAANAANTTAAQPEDGKGKDKNASAQRNETLARQVSDYLGTYCMGGATLALNSSRLEPLMLALPENMTSEIAQSLAENAPQCCVFGACNPCCNTAACAGDPSSYPLLFVHGHAFNDWNSPEYSLGGYFSRIQHQLQQDGYLDAGIITPSSTIAEVGPGEWGLSGRPVTVRVTYYYNFYRAGDEYVIVPQTSESIETYAIRLKEMIDIAKHHTGKQKVNIVAHSMGGLVVRRYLQLFGEDSVGTVILIGTPDAGIDARTRSLCPVFGASKECDDMAKDSVFMRKLNDAQAQPAKTRVVTITGHGCKVGGNDGDGVVEAASVPLPFAKNYDINGTCTSFFGTDLHTELLNIDDHPQTYEIIKKELRK